MVTGTRARTYEEMVDALADGLQALEEKLSGLSEEDWKRPTLLQPPIPEAPPWNVLQLAAHFDIFMGMTMTLVGESQPVQVLDRASFCLACSERSQVAPAIYKLIVDHAEGHTPVTVLDTVRQTFKQALEAIRSTPPDTIGPTFFGPMRLDEFVATRLVEVAAHGMDLADALGEPQFVKPGPTTMAAEVLDEVLARRWVPGRPADLEGDDLAFLRAAAGRGEHPDPRLPVWG